MGKVQVDELVVWYCEQCDRIYDEDDAKTGGPLYECGECGTIFNRDNSANGNHQCPDCNKFGHKLAEVSCPEGCDVELDERVALEYNGVLFIEKPED